MEAAEQLLPLVLVLVLRAGAHFAAYTKSNFSALGTKHKAQKMKKAIQGKTPKRKNYE